MQLHIVRPRPPLLPPPGTRCRPTGQTCLGHGHACHARRDLLLARWCEPTLSVVDIRLADEDTVAEDSAYRFGPTRFSVIPRAAVGNVSIRFVPDQSADHLISCFRWRPVMQSCFCCVLYSVVLSLV